MMIPMRRLLLLFVFSLPLLAQLPDVTNIVGRYAYDADDVLTFKVDGDRVTVTRTAQPPARLEAVSPTEFINRETGQKYVFGKDAVTTGGVTLQRTRAAIPFDLLPRDPKLGVAQYELLEGNALTDERLRLRGVWMLDQGNRPAALALLTFNAERNAKSALAHDALATAQIMANDAASARVSAQKVLDLLAAETTLTATQRQLLRERSECRVHAVKTKP
jgi:hypothetical protein